MSTVVVRNVIYIIAYFYVRVFFVDIVRTSLESVKAAIHLSSLENLVQSASAIA